MRPPVMSWGGGEEGEGGCQEAAENHEGVPGPHAEEDPAHRQPAEAHREPNERQDGQRQQKRDHLDSKHREIEDIKQAFSLKQTEEADRQKRISNTRCMIDDLRAEVANLGDQESVLLISARYLYKKDTWEPEIFLIERGSNTYFPH